MLTTKAKKEMLESKKRLEEISGKKIVSFAYPYGNCSQSLKKIALDCGYIFAVSTDHGAAHPEYDFSELFRANIFPEDSNRKLLRKASYWYRDYFYYSRRKEVTTD
jgi:peptidoglycan/xylan/chitin deacetylase (PgdA/CDA1 family)